jgi:hypothetical protein
MTIRFFRPHDALRGIVARLYVHDSEAPEIAGQRWLIVPDGELKLIFPYRGAIGCSIGGTESLHPESRLIVSGMRDRPGHLRFPGTVGAVGVILHAHAIHRLTGIPQHEIANRTLDGEDATGAVVAEMRQMAVSLEALAGFLSALPAPITVAIESCLYWQWLHDQLDAR